MHKQRCHADAKLVPLSRQIYAPSSYQTAMPEYADTTRGHLCTVDPFEIQSSGHYRFTKLESRDRQLLFLRHHCIVWPRAAMMTMHDQNMPTFAQGWRLFHANAVGVANALGDTAPMMKSLHAMHVAVLATLFQTIGMHIVLQRAPTRAELRTITPPEPNQPVFCLQFLSEIHGLAESDVSYDRICNLLIVPRIGTPLP